MFQHVPPANVSVRRRILLMCMVLISANLAQTLSKNSRVYLFEQARCLIYYQINEPTKVNSGNGVQESLCKIKDIQRPLSILVGVDAMLAMLPSKCHTLMPFDLGIQITGLTYTKKFALVLLVLGIYKQLLPQVGLRRLLVVSLSCSAIGVVLSTFVCTYIYLCIESFGNLPVLQTVWLRQSWTTPVVLMLNICDIVGGGDMTRMIMTITCIAEISHPEKLYGNTPMTHPPSWAVMGAYLFTFRTTTYNYLTGVSIFGFRIPSSQPDPEP